MHGVAGGVRQRSQPKPLKLGIAADMAASGLMDAAEIEERLKLYVGLPQYLRACTAGAVRVDLDGKPAGTVSEREAGYAAARLASANGEKPPR